MRSSCTWCVRTVNVFRHTNRGVFRVHTSLVLLVLLEFMLCVVAAACHLYEGNQLVLELNSWDPWTGLGLLLKSVVAEHVPGAGKLFGSGITPPQQRRVLALLIALVLPVVCWAAEIALWLLLPYFEVVYHGAAVSQGCFAQPPVNAPHPGRKHCEDAVSFVHRCGTVVVFGRTWSALLACIEYYEGALHTNVRSHVGGFCCAGRHIFPCSSHSHGDAATESASPPLQPQLGQIPSNVRLWRA